MHDPADGLEWSPIPRPRFHGPGSGKAAWIDHARTLATANHGLQRLVDEQSAAIREQKGEIALLKRQIAARRPKGGWTPLPDEKAARIEEEIARGGTDRGIAARYHVSHMSGFRIRKRMQQRKAAG